MKTILTKATNIAYALGVLFANTLTTQPFSKKGK